MINIHTIRNQLTARLEVVPSYNIFMSFYLKLEHCLFTHTDNIFGMHLSAIEVKSTPVH